MNGPARFSDAGDFRGPVAGRRRDKAFRARRRNFLALGLPPRSSGVCHQTFSGIMKKQKVIPRKKTGPAPTGKGQPVVVRMHPPQLKALDAWIAQQVPPFPSRPEAVRRLVELALANSKK